MADLTVPSPSAVTSLDSYFQYEDNKSLLKQGANIADKHYPYQAEGWDDTKIPESTIQLAYWAYRKLQINNEITDEQILNG
jgi:hypothetical protein